MGLNIMNRLPTDNMNITHKKSCAYLIDQKLLNLETKLRIQRQIKIKHALA